MTPGSRVALVGLGEVGRTFAEDLLAAGRHEVTAWDTAFADPASPASSHRRDLGLPLAAGLAQALDGADLIVSAVTACSCVAAATEAAAALGEDAWFLDLDSASPGHKQEAARAVAAGGGRYVEAALMAPIGPQRLASPFLLGGPHAAAFAAVTDRWGLTAATVVSDEVGRAAATKLCRSVVVKGLEALLTESLLAARTFGVEREVLDSLPNVLPPADWEAVAGYFVSRSLEHGARRAEEMEEAAATVAEAGVEPWMARATVERQRFAARHRHAASAGGVLDIVDAVLAASDTDDRRGAPA